MRSARELRTENKGLIHELGEAQDKLRVTQENLKKAIDETKQAIAMLTEAKTNFEELATKE